MRLGSSIKLKGLIPEQEKPNTSSFKWIIQNNKNSNPIIIFRFQNSNSLLCRYLAEAGLIDHWELESVSSTTLAYLKDVVNVQIVNEDKPLVISHVAMIHGFLALGLFIATMVFLTEVKPWKMIIKQCCWWQSQLCTPCL